MLSAHIKKRKTLKKAKKLALYSCYYYSQKNKLDKCFAIQATEHEHRCVVLFKVMDD